MDIFFGHEISLETERMLNIDMINLLRQRQASVGEKALKASMRSQYGPSTFGKNQWKTNNYGSTTHMYKDKSADSQFE